MNVTWYLHSLGKAGTLQVRLSAFDAYAQIADACMHVNESQ